MITLIQIHKLTCVAELEPKFSTKKDEARGLIFLNLRSLILDEESRLET